MAEERLNGSPADWLGKRPFLIAGPCSAESEEQVLSTCNELVSLVPEVGMLRAGIWKPRTRPDSFEGRGAEALSWLVNAGREAGRPVCTEVALPDHVEAALKAGVDALWIGARTTVSPFLVQDIADALQGTDVPVFVKNPINPDLELWIGAIERLERAGINRLAAIHRGFSSYENMVYRNRPSWEIPIELRRRVPQLPILCDPSHISGDRELVGEVAQRAMDLGFDGWMIESHRSPEDALSDPAQQLKPLALREMLASLVVRQVDAGIPGARHQLLQELRSKIDRIDDYILELLGERMEIARAIGHYKKDQQMTVFQPERWQYTVVRSLEKGKNNKLTEDFILHLFQQIHKESIHQQIGVIRSGEEGSMAVEEPGKDYESED